MKKDEFFVICPRNLNKPLQSANIVCFLERLRDSLKCAAPRQPPAGWWLMSAPLTTTTHLGHTCLLFCTYIIPEPLPWVSKRTLLLQLRTSATMSTRLCLTMSWRRCDHWPSQALYHFSSLQVYALYKQATIGDVNTSRPGMLDFKVANPIPSRESHSSKHEIMNTCTILWKKSLHWINLNFNLIISLLNIQGKAKWDAWNGKKGMDQVNQVLFE